MAAKIPASFPSTMLHTNQRAVKEAAQAEPVLITCTDNHNLVMASRQQLAQQLAAQQDQRNYELAVLTSIDKGMEDFQEGNFLLGTADEVISAMERAPSVQ